MCYLLLVGKRRKQIADWFFEFSHLSSLRALILIWKLSLTLKALGEEFNSSLTLFDMGGMMAPQNVFVHCPQTLRRRKLKLGDY